MADIRKSHNNNKNRVELPGLAKEVVKSAPVRMQVQESNKIARGAGGGELEKNESGGVKNCTHAMRPAEMKPALRSRLFLPFARPE